MELEQGHFKRITGYPDYEINHCGHIRRVWQNGKKTTLTPVIKRGMYVIRLTDPIGKRKEQRVHKLMQRTFFSPKPGHVFFHRNGNRLDNWINNLGYIARSDLGKRTGGQSRKAVMKIEPNGEVIEIYRSAREAARHNFMSYQTVIDRCNGKVKKQIAPDGFVYRWEDQDAARGRPKKQKAM